MKKKLSHLGISSLKSKGRGLQMGFTLVEIMVAITIFMIVMVSVLQIFGISVNITNKVDITRQMQLNTKNITETIAEDIRKNSISGASDKTDISGNYNLLKGNGLRVGNIKYYLSKDINSNGRLLDISSCKLLKNNCFLVKDDGMSQTRLTNSWVAFEDLNFTILGDKVKRVVVNFTMRPATKKGIRAKLIKKSKMIFETTLSERFVKTN